MINEAASYDKGRRLVKLRSLFKILIMLTIIFLISIYAYPVENDHIKNDEIRKPPMYDESNLLPGKIEDHSERPKEGISALIGKPVATLEKQFGEPNRVDPSAYEYDWWIYNDSSDSYMQIGVLNDKIVSVYVVGDAINIKPFHIGQSIEDIYRSTLLETEILIQLSSGTYRFELTEEDLNIRPLVQMGGIFAQLTIDKFTGQLSSIRFMDKLTLVKTRPYEMSYRGELLDSDSLSERQWREVENSNEKQIFDLTNIIRKRFDLEPLNWDEEVAEVAYHHSKEMNEQDYFSHTSPKHGEVSNRMDKAKISYRSVGENIASQYIDAPAAVAGWLNSEGHRKALLNKDFTHLGVGVYQKHYTQNFIKK